MSLVSLLLSMIELVDHTNIGETVEDNIHNKQLAKNGTNHKTMFMYSR